MKSYQMISRGLLYLLFTVIGLTSSAIAKSKDDVIILNNGDRLTGEIKSLEHGELKFKSSYMVDSKGEKERPGYHNLVRVEILNGLSYPFPTSHPT